MDLNSITLTARLTTDATVRSVGETSVCTLRVAYTQRSEKQSTGFIDVEVWGSYGETCAHLAKGARVGVSGELRFSEWETAEGGKRQGFTVRADRVAFLSPKGTEEAGDAAEAEPAAVAA